MPKQKTHKGLAKRVSVSGRGKLMRQRAGKGHLLSGKSSKRRRQLRRKAVLKGAAAVKARKLLGA